MDFSMVSGAPTILHFLHSQWTEIDSQGTNCQCAEDHPIHDLPQLIEHVLLHPRDEVDRDFRWNQMIWTVKIKIGHKMGHKNSTIEELVDVEEEDDDEAVVIAFPPLLPAMVLSLL